jgi:hypothetical protein
VYHNHRIRPLCKRLPRRGPMRCTRQLVASPVAGPHSRREVRASSLAGPRGTIQTADAGRGGVESIYKRQQHRQRR